MCLDDMLLDSKSQIKQYCSITYFFKFIIVFKCNIILAFVI